MVGSYVCLLYSTNGFKVGGIDWRLDFTSTLTNTITVKTFIHETICVSFK